MAKTPGAILVHPRRSTGISVSKTKDRLYYDGQCPLCRTEVKHLQTLADEALELVDIHQLADDNNRLANPALPPRQQLLKRLHLERAGDGIDGGELRVGLDANVAAWQHTRYGMLVRWLRWPWVRRLVDPLYSYWADVRYRRLYGSTDVDK